MMRAVGGTATQTSCAALATYPEGHGLQMPSGVPWEGKGQGPSGLGWMRTEDLGAHVAERERVRGALAGHEVKVDEVKVKK